MMKAESAPGAIWGGEGVRGKRAQLSEIQGKSSRNKGNEVSRGRRRKGILENGFLTVTPINTGKKKILSNRGRPILRLLGVQGETKNVWVRCRVELVIFTWKSRKLRPRSGLEFMQSK